MAANENEYVLRLANIRPTPKDKGVMTTLELKIMDNNIITVNDGPMGGMGGAFPTKDEAIAGMHRIVAQIMEELIKASVRRSHRIQSQKQYAPKEALENESAIITSVIPNPKQVGSKSRERYGKFHFVGQTIGEYIRAYREAGESSTLARADLRWDLEHGFITIENPTA